MAYICLLTRIGFALLVAATFILGGVILRRYQVRHKGKALSDQQIIWLLVGLLVIAAISMSAFMLFLFRGFSPWHHFSV